MQPTQDQKTMEESVLPAWRFVQPVPESNQHDVSRGFYVGVTGDVHMVTGYGTEVTLKNLAQGVIHPIRVKKILNDKTTATDMFLVY